MALQPLGSVNPGALEPARRALHHAVQLIASAGAALAEPQADDSHRAMTWEPELQAFRGVDLRGDFFVRVGAADLSAAVVERGGILVGEVSLSGRPLTESLRLLQEWMPVSETERAFGFTKFDDKLPDPDFLSTPLQPAPADHQVELALYYGHAYAAIKQLAAAHPPADPIRIWPHHFDIATIFRLGPQDQQIGFGLSPGDAGCPEPYWYVTPWPLPAGATANPPPEGARWHTEGWTGLELRASDFVGRPNSDAFVAQTLEDCLHIARQSVG